VSLPPEAKAKNSAFQRVIKLISVATLVLVSVKWILTHSVVNMPEQASFPPASIEQLFVFMYLMLCMWFPPLSQASVSVPDAVLRCVPSLYGDFSSLKNPLIRTNRYFLEVEIDLPINF
jgi:hypothetical protein